MTVGNVRPRTTKSLAGNVTLVLGSIALALILAELLLRALGVSRVVAFRADRLTGYAHIPGAEGWYTSEGRSYVRMNTGGWRDREHAFTKPAGVTRIAILGDSYMEAFPVPEDSAFPALLERTLNRTLPGRYEVLNFGVSGFGTAQELLVLQHDAFRYAPDVVILAFTTANDISDNSPTLKWGADLPAFRLVDRRLVLDTSFLTSRGFLSASGWRARTLTFLALHSRVVQLARHAKHRMQAARAIAREERLETAADSLHRELSVQFEVYLNAPPDSVWAEAWNVTEGLLGFINNECRSRHIRFFLVTLSNPPQVTPDSLRLRALAGVLGVPDLLQPERRLEHLGMREGFPVLALAPLLSAQAIATHQYYHGFGKYPGTGHWNERGHRAAAMLVSAWLAKRLGN